MASAVVGSASSAASATSSAAAASCRARACPLLGTYMARGLERSALSRALPTPPLISAALGGVRTVIRHPVRTTGMILGHKLEVQYGHHTKRRHNPPKIPKHPMQDIDQNMNEVLTYSDLKLRWQWTTKFNKNKMTIARHWKPKPNRSPVAKPTCSFVWHTQMPHHEKMPEMPATLKDGKLPKLDKSLQKGAFAVFKSGVMHQHKVTVGDIVQIEKLHRREAGEKVVFGTVLLVGTRDFTIIGKPVVPYAKVKATIEQQTLCREMLTFKYRPGGRQSRFLRRRQYITMVRIDEIIVDPEMDVVDKPPPKPVRLLDLWANRWLDPAEKAEIAMEDVKNEQGQVTDRVPKTALIYDGSEHQPGSYHRRGLTECYRFYPDPQHTHWML